MRGADIARLAPIERFGGDMFDTADPLIGIQRVKFDGNRACARCNNKVAVIGDGYELIPAFVIID
jgi:hypothetical protein